MEADTHPTELNNLARYRHAVKIAANSSRLKNPDWYGDALDLDAQLHLYMVDETGVECYLHVKSTQYYEKLENLTQHQLEKTGELETFIDTLLKRSDLAKAKSMGVILYLADELSLAGLGPEHQNPAEINDLRARIAENPTEVLEDKTITAEARSWGLFPYPGAEAGSEFATAVAISREPAVILEKLRNIGVQRNFPIQTAAVCAPLCAIASLPWFLKANEKGSIAVFNYSKFTLLAICNDFGDLMMLRYMPHPNGKTAPANIGAAALASASSFELEEPEINIFSMENNDVDSLIVSLQSSLLNSEILLTDFKEFLISKSLPEDTRIEMAVVTQEMDSSIYPLAENNTYTTLSDDKWHLQDFLMPDEEETVLFPTAGDIKTLKTGRMIKKIAALITIGAVSYAGWSIWSKMKDEAWLYKKENSHAAAAQLTAELQDYKKWDNLLKDRSKAWVSMELLSCMIPNDGSVVMKDARHIVSQRTDPASKTAGLQKEWIIIGQANEKGIATLGEISTRDGIKDLFRKVAENTGNEAFLPDVNQRDVTVSLKQDINPRKVGGSDGGVYMPYKFRMTIKQTFGAKDSMAVAGGKYTK